MSLLLLGYSLYLSFLRLIAAFHFDRHVICVGFIAVLQHVSGEIGHFFLDVRGHRSYFFELLHSSFHGLLEVGVISTIFAKSVHNEIGISLYNHCSGFANNDCVETEFMASKLTCPESGRKLEFPSCFQAIGTPVNLSLSPHTGSRR